MSTLNTYYITVLFIQNAMAVFVTGGVFFGNRHSSNDYCFSFETRKLFTNIFSFLFFFSGSGFVMLFIEPARKMGAGEK